MASGYISTLMLRHGKRWHPLAKQFSTTDTQDWLSYYHHGQLPPPMGVWGQKPPMETRASNNTLGAQHSTNSWTNVPRTSSPRPPVKRKPVPSRSSSPWGPVPMDTNMLFKPTIRRQAQTVGRFFPKPSLTDAERVLLAAKTGRPLSGSYLMSNKYQEIRKLTSKITYTSAPTERQPRPVSSCNQKIASTRKTLFNHMENLAKSEVFMISFRDECRGDYDPNSELHSDYYTVKRHVKFSPIRQVSVPTKEAEFADVIRGKSKRMHSRG